MLDSPADRLPNWPRGLREDLAAAYIGLSITTFRRERSEGRAPKPVHLTPGRQVWLREDLDNWLDQKAGATKDHPALRSTEALVGEWDAACYGTGEPSVP